MHTKVKRKYLSGGRGSKSALSEMQQNPFQTSIFYNGDQTSYINKRRMIGRHIALVIAISIIV